MISAENMIKRIVEANSKGLMGENFNTSFVVSLQQGLRKFGSLTARQESALNNIYTSFDVETKLAQAKESAVTNENDYKNDGDSIPF